MGRFAGPPGRIGRGGARAGRVVGGVASKRVGGTVLQGRQSGSRVAHHDGTRPRQAALILAAGHSKGPNAREMRAASSICPSAPTPRHQSPPAPPPPCSPPPSPPLLPP